MIERMWELLSTFTPESQKNVMAKCEELGFNKSRGEVNLDESYINLNTCVSLLKEAIEKKKLIQLPITVQKVIIASLESIVKAQTNLLIGSDEVVNLTAYIESLNASMWQYGLFNLSDEVLGYQTKLNQLKQLEVEVADLNSQLKDGVKLKKKLDEAQTVAEQRLTEINTSLTNATSVLGQINQLLTDSSSSNQQIAALLATAQQNDSNITQAKANAVQNAADVSAMESKVKEFFAEIAEYKSLIDKTSDEATAAVGKNTAATDDLINTLSDLESQIKDQLQKATGHSLFHSFQTRQGLIAESKNFWMYALAALLVLTALLTIYLIKSVTGASQETTLNVAFFLKLSLSIPLIFAISFCTVQYSRERRLEEEYAFKSNISISLVPYQELVEKLVAMDDLEQRKEYATFIMNTINKVFTSPTEEIFKDKGSGKGLVDMKALKKIGEIAESISKIKGAN